MDLDDLLLTMRMDTTVWLQCNGSRQWIQCEWISTVFLLIQSNGLDDLQLIQCESISNPMICEWIYNCVQCEWIKPQCKTTNSTTRGPVIARAENNAWVDLIQRDTIRVLSYFIRLRTGRHSNRRYLLYAVLLTLRCQP